MAKKNPPDEMMDETTDAERERSLKEKQGKIKRPDFGADENSPKNPEARPLRHK